jgi:exodeoxyribonuclease VII large subunit
MENILHSRKIMLASAAGKLEAVNPLAVLARGYGVVKGSGGEIVSSVDAVELGSTVHLLVKDGDITATVTDKEYISRG